MKPSIHNSGSPAGRHEFLERLERAVEGLAYVSETDAALVPFVWRNKKTPLTEAEILEITNHPPDTKVEVTTADWFFRNAVRDDLYGPKDARRYRELKRLLDSELRNIQVFRIGEINIEVYLVGETASGELAGVGTRVVET